MVLGPTGAPILGLPSAGALGLSAVRWAWLSPAPWPRGSHEGSPRNYGSPRIYIGPTNFIGFPIFLLGFIRISIRISIRILSGFRFDLILIRFD